MRERGAVFDDVRSSLANARTCRAQPKERWRVSGPDVSGDEMTLIVVLEDGVVVVTLF